MSQPSTRMKLYLPDECWESVFNFLPYQKSLSLISKRFLSITNNLRSSLTILPATPLGLLPHLIYIRFPNLTSLHIRHIYLSEFFVRPIYTSNYSLIRLRDLAVEKNKSTCPFKSITFHNIINITDDDLILIVECFSSIQQLDISSYRSCDRDVTDIGIRTLSIGLTKLRKVVISGYFINDSKLVILCKHSPLLEKVIITCDKYITQHGIASAIKQMLNLVSFSVKRFNFENNSPDLIASLMGLRNMTFLDLSFSCISDELLISIAKVHVSLKKLVLRGCRGYNYVGIYILLLKCRLVQHLDLHDTEFLEDEHIIELSKFLSHLKFIDLSDCSNITDLGLSALTKNCPLLNHMKTKEPPKTWTDIGRFCCKLSIEDEEILRDEGRCNCWI
ncbi:hypothetical protein Lal_00023679 [Lupinus albus]|uniref:Putative leucine-rich repeat domain, L domain-containing protein n=1 Tax=Lupinus albus TaxID=3870 RepID=A0A6A4R5B0_LUPAL|nr:putative leucine-rich repeat domain, L domain-containing protein [Lupinus albus]KAF1898670.1 hypothetical protein Lal_00023679 [Lupinus albus]